MDKEKYLKVLDGNLIANDIITKYCDLVELLIEKQNNFTLANRDESLKIILDIKTLTEKRERLFK